MANPVLLVRREVGWGNHPRRACLVWCPGCDNLHRMTVANEDGTHPVGEVWGWDGNETEPTFDPSILVRATRGDTGEDYMRCHSYLRAGRWDFLGDSLHQLAGQSGVAMVPVPDWLVAEGRTEAGAQ